MSRDCVTKLLAVCKSAICQPHAENHGQRHPPAELHQRGLCWIVPLYLIYVAIVLTLFPAGVQNPDKLRLVHESAVN